MSQSVSHTNASLQAVSRKISSLRTLQTGYVPRRRRITRPFLALPEDTPVVRLSLQPCLWHLIKLCGTGSWCQITHADLGAALGRSEATAQRWIYALEEAGVIEVTRVWVSKDKSLPNRYRLPHLEGFFELANKVSISADQVPTEDLKTTTLPVKPEPKARPAYSRSAENHDPRVRERVEHNALARHHRLTRSHQHGPDAFVGVGIKPDGYYSGVTSDEDEWAAVRQRVLERESKLRGVR